MRFDLIVFDLDGTLIDSVTDLTSAINHALRQCGYPLRTEQDVRAAIGDGARKLVERSLPPRADVEIVFERFRRAYLEVALTHTRPFDGVDALLDALQGPVALATNKPEAPTRVILAGLGWQDRFVEVVAGDTLPFHKPDGRVLEHLARATGVSCARIAMIGDAPQDVLTARAVGATAIGVTWGTRDRAVLEAAGAALVVDTIHELREALGLAPHADGAT